ncbi:hypothetical protein [Deinococcus pimensis]|uniref:hypothetical protein n=1 Tax=Deinococcus pimensis TaxID=309888 RepID=UPI0004809E55|nr:hypothetical protein [Deinococcus pimensis]
MNLPARVRISRLPGPPGDALRAQLARLSPDLAPALLARLPSPDVVCLVVIAGGRTVGALLAERAEGGAWRETLAMEASWRGRGIEAALREELARA